MPEKTNSLSWRVAITSSLFPIVPMWILLILAIILTPTQWWNFLILGILLTVVILGINYLFLRYQTRALIMSLMVLAVLMVGTSITGSAIRNFVAETLNIDLDRLAGGIGVLSVALYFNDQLKKAHKRSL